ncbi:tRNA lysidine(34) synthetase TilS [Paenibacillus sp. MAHUQ-46]|uniref:tRNA(Ile)-lysidine synthase n=2 Tax=Paenibacillus TaxID=44249 RepID=A0A934J0W3_9BACL|nr:tRNA lysidine(34) synthetase TilS [Paenibacillus roseus]
MEIMEELVKRVRDAAAEYGLWRAGDTILTALSGGPDSMALLHILQQLAEAEQLTLAAAHVNHGFRIEESAREAAVVAQWCAIIGIPLKFGELALPDYIERTGMNAQAAAREHRYAFLHEAAAACGAQRIALGHHADDQSETVMMRIIRGTSPGGLSGMPVSRTEKNVELIRPLLRINKSELLSYCDRHQLPYSTDSSNFKRNYFRNKVRLDVIPYLEKLNPKLPESLLRLADMARSDDDYIEQQAVVLFKERVRLEAGRAVMNRSALTDIHVALQRRMIKLILNYLIQEKDAITYERIEAIREAAKHGSISGESMDAGGGIRFSIDYGTLLWQQAKDSNSFGPYEYELAEHAGRLLIAQTRMEWIVDTLNIPGKDWPTRPVSRYEAWFDSEALAYPLFVRNRRPGDYMEVLGLNGTKKVQDMFVDAKWPRSKRDTAPILCDANGRILWIPGLRRSVHALVGKTSKVLRMRVTCLSE